MYNKFYKTLYNKYFILSSITLILGIITYVLYNNWIIIALPKKYQLKNISTYKDCNLSKKEYIKFYYWKYNKWQTQNKQVIISNIKSNSISYIINSWLSLLNEEQILHKRISLQSVMLDDTNQDAFISFDRNLFLKTQSIHDKWMLIESLLKTLKDSPISIKNVNILVHQQPLNDFHLDFSHSWPIEGFYES